MLIKPVLILVLTACYFYYMLRVRDPLPLRSTGLVMLLVAVYFILFPDVSSRVAGFFGVGRGVDFVFYFLFTFLIFIVLVINVRLNRQASDITRLARELALLQARAAEDDGGRSPWTLTENNG
ncbi:MAG: DUF2304 domain-containing protein [Thermodesulfobacteriota bacterium]